MFDCEICFNNEETKQMKFKTVQHGNVITATFPEDVDLSQVKYVTVKLHEDDICFGDEGYYVFSGTGSTVCKAGSIGYFKERQDVHHENRTQHMPIFGLRHNGKGFLCIITGMRFNFWPVMDIKNGKYEFSLKYVADKQGAYENPSFEMHLLEGEDCQYVQMAKIYRNYRLSRDLKPIKERLNPELKYAAESMLVRIRNGWKPAPCEVTDQTLKNEPPMHVACTFSDVEKIMYAYKEKGIEKVEFTLVGWNIKGHDGRWPQILPVEESLGGEEGLRHLLLTAKELGYVVTCHTNSTDAYGIANNFSTGDIIVNNSDQLDTEKPYWSGGRMFHLCPEASLRLAKETLPEVSELGFRGIHYIDVITAVEPRQCFSRQHRVTKAQCEELWNDVMGLAKDLFGGSSSEGGFDPCLKNCDFVLYTSFARDVPEIVDEFIPLWELVFHGIVMSNPYSFTINATASDDPADFLKVIEYGARPSIYYFSRFVNNANNWIGKGDFRTDSEENFKESIENSAKMYEAVTKLSGIQYEFMENHERIEEGVYRTTYSDGRMVTVNYNDNTYFVEVK